MPNKFKRPSEPGNALYHDVLCGHVEGVRDAIRETPELIRGKPVITGAWSHGGRRCAAEDDVIDSLWLIIKNGATFEQVGTDTIDSAFKTFPRAANLLLAHGANPNAVDNDGIPILHRVIEIGYRSAAEVLLKYGADINGHSGDGETPLDVAAKHDLPRIARYLRQHGGSPHRIARDNVPDRPIERTVETYDGRLKGEVAWYRADRGYGYLRDQTLNCGLFFFDRESIVGAEPSSIEQETDLGFSLMHDEFGLRATDVKFGEINHHLHAYCGDTDIVREALNEGADPNFLHATEGSTLLHNICYCRRKLRHPDEDDPNVIRRGLWNDAPWVELLQLVIGAGADVHAKTNVGVPQEAAQPWEYHGESPLHLAAASWALHLVRELLAAGADKHTENAHGETPYRWAVRYRACQEIKTLLLPDGDRMKDDGRYPYQWNSDAWNSTAWAAFFRANEDDCLAELELAMQLGLDPNDESGPEGRPLSSLANSGQDELINYLLQRGADVNDKRGEVATPLHTAAAQGFTSTVRLLLSHGADPNAIAPTGVRGEAFYCPFRGETPLHLAAAYGDIEMAEALVTSGADRYALDAYGAGVFDYYRRHRGENRDATGLRSLLRSWSTPKA